MKRAVALWGLVALAVCGPRVREADQATALVPYNQDTEAILFLGAIHNPN